MIATLFWVYFTLCAAGTAVRFALWCRDTVREANRIGQWWARMDACGWEYDSWEE